MYLSKLELHGFKSFASPTVLRFDPGITAIVGPNGCGKSNIVDAIRWVIGEQRARILRSEKMENVIFNGTSRRRPLGLAEVQLTVENTRGVLPTEYTEVTLGRRLYRSGDSEYLLNGTPCRLRDIVDLFMDTGMGAGAYSVIELKMIEEILSDSAYDRRHLFEEAAGITKYKQRRTQALRKLDSTQADLTRLRDLTEEIEKRVRSLKRQATRAARYKEYEERLRAIELALAQVEYSRLTEQEHVLQVERQDLQDTLQEHTARLARDEAEREALRKTLIDQERILSEGQQHVNEHLTAVRDLEADVRLEQERLDGAGRDRDRIHREQEEALQQRKLREAAAERFASDLAVAEPLRAEAGRVLREAEAARDGARSISDARRQTLHELRHREHDIVEERAAYHRQLDRLANRLELLGEEREHLHQQLGALAETNREYEVRLQEAGEQMEVAESRLVSARENLAEAEREHEAVKHRLEEATAVLHQIERQHDAAVAEVHLLDSLVTSFDEFPDAVRFLAAAPGWSHVAPRTVADVFSCEAAYRAALDAALGDLGACLIVETEHEAYQAVALLRAEGKGQATFLVMDRLPDEVLSGSTVFAEHEAAQPLRDCVHVTDPVYGCLAALLLRDCYFVASLDDVSTVEHSSNDAARYFASTGEWVEARGLLHAGSEHAGPSMVAGRIDRREQLQAMREQADVLQADLERRAAAVETLRATLEAVPVEARRLALAEVERAFADAEREHGRLVYEQQTLARRRADLEARLASCEAEIQAGEEAFEAPRAAVADAETRLTALQADREAAERAFQDAEVASLAAQDRLADATVGDVEARNRCDNLRRDLERTHRELEALAQRAEQRRNDLEGLRATIDAARAKTANLQQQLGTVRGQRAGLDARVADAKTALLETKVKIDRIEGQLRKGRQDREEAIREENVRAVRQAEIHTRREDLIETIRENFGVALGVDPVEVDDDFVESAARDEVKDLRQAMKSMGNVNALALEEYETERERYEFMAEQQKDLEHAETTLLQTIDEINTTAARRFTETYESIRASFRDLFGELFGHDASADLQLVDPDDPLESPIDIVAKPRGKRPIHIAQLSSGEKTLTAIALLFAIYLVKPSPFCFLDEVDAPLDDANIDRFMRLIRRFSTHTQFILVTHNKRTMEMADRLYGITMQEQGISRLVGVRFEEAMAMAS